MTAGMPLKPMMRSQIPAVPMAQPHRSTGAIHADRAGGTAPTPEAVTGNARWPEPGQGTGSPDPCKEERGKKKKPTYWDGLYLGSDMPTPGLDPEKTVQFELDRGTPASTTALLTTAKTQVQVSADR